MAFYYIETFYLWPIVDSLSSQIYCQSCAHTLDQSPAALFRCVGPYKSADSACFRVIAE